MMAALVWEPFYLRPWEVERLRIRTITRVYYHPRDDKGNLELNRPYAQERRTYSYEEKLEHIWRMRGIPEHKIKQAIAEEKRDAEKRAKEAEGG